MKVVQTISSPGTIVNVLTTGSPLTLDCDGEITAPDVPFTPDPNAYWGPDIGTTVPVSVALNALADINRAGSYANLAVVGPTTDPINLTPPDLSRTASGNYLIWCCCSANIAAFTQLQLFGDATLIAAARSSPGGIAQSMTLSTFGIYFSAAGTVQLSASLTSADVMTVEAGEFRIMWLEIGG